MSEKIKPGYKTGAMTVLEQTGRMVGKYPVWRCRCECGREIDLDEGIIKMGTVKDCGCGRHKNPAISVLTGQRFGRLTVIGIDPQHGTKSSAAWLCKCDCGNYVTVAEKNLKTGCTRSCGCLSRPFIKDLVGNKYGRLTVLEYKGRKAKVHMWLCRCECCRTTIVNQYKLENHLTVSCGCLNTEQTNKAIGLFQGTSIRRLECILRKTTSNSSSGFTGVYYNKPSGKWVAEGALAGKRYFLGSFTTKVEAIQRRQEFNQKIKDFLYEYYTAHPEWKKPEDYRECP